MDFLSACSVSAQKTCGAICSYERQKRRGRELYHKKKGTGENAE